MKPAEYHAAARKLRGEQSDNSRPIQVACLASYSLEFLDPFLIVESDKQHLAINAWYSPYGQIEQPLLEPEQSLRQEPDVWLIALRIEDQFPDAFLRSHNKSGTSLQEITGQCIDRLRDCVAIIRRTSDAPVLISNFSVPYEQNHSRLFDATNPGGQRHAVEQGNFELASALHELPGVTIWDYAGLVNAHGSANWTDQRLWQVARQPISTENRPGAAVHLAATISALLAPRSKCLVLDLDNTLWGGAAGDDGMEGIQLGDDHPGLAYKMFQRAVLALSDQGVLLAACSKNDEENARRIIDSHPEMLIRWSDFVATRINWLPKSENLHAIASDLNIGIDALVLFDDNPVEREEVRINAPEVSVINVPVSPLQYVNALFSANCFDVSALSNEDYERGDLYRSEAKRKNHGSGFATVDEFLASLKMNATIGNANSETLSRIAHLIAKTNQFNLTTRRHSQAGIEALGASEATEVRWIRVADRFGDNGIIGVTITNFQDDTATIDSFLMSCRVMNRNIEDAMLVDVLMRAKDRNIKTVIGEFSATDRNSIVADFYTERGFHSIDNSDGSAKRFSIETNDAIESLVWPETLSIREHVGE